jgi:alkylation response protein AidB-like acyl-CoA dehydrogenase
MANVLVDERDHRFVMQEMLEVQKLCQTERFKEHSPETFEMILDAGYKMALNEIWPTYQEGDHSGGAKLVNGRVVLPECFVGPYQKFVEGGWLTLEILSEHGGQQMPMSVAIGAMEAFVAANPAFFFLTFGAIGAGRLVENFGDDRQRRLYMEPLYEGRWGGTMALTEPGAGSDVGALRTTATRLPDGRFKIEGTKVFISNGDQNLTENVVHPVLARIEGDPPGTKGISIFLVPRIRVNEDGSLGEYNDIATANIEKKMGLKASPTCLLNFGENGECIGELLGEERAGMRIMFQMMNEARIHVGLQGLGHSSAAFLHARNYAKERLQGSSVENMKDPKAPRVPIIQHPDVRRMLLSMKSTTEGMRALIFYASYCVDKMHTTEGEEAARWDERLALLTPVVKAYCSDQGFRVCETAIQIYGGYGFCQEYPVEQFLRDCKVASIYEGCNGIQAMDLIGRKLGIRGGQALFELLTEIGELADRHAQGPLAQEAAILAKAKEVFGDVAMHLMTSARSGGFKQTLVNACPVLELMGDLLLGWLLLWQAGIAQANLEKLAPGAEDAKLDELCGKSSDIAYYIGKLATARFFLHRVLALAAGKAEVIKGTDDAAVWVPEVAI